MVPPRPGPRPPTYVTVGADRMRTLSRYATLDARWHLLGRRLAPGSSAGTNACMCVDPCRAGNAPRAASRRLVQSENSQRMGPIILQITP
jgi:hypothetical protein